MRLRDRLQKIIDLRWEYDRARRINQIVNYPEPSGNLDKKMNKIAKEHNSLVFWFMKKLPEDV